jgi:hypothetical protein
MSKELFIPYDGRLYRKDVVGQTTSPLSSDEIDSQSYNVGTRNMRGVLQVPIYKDSVCVNFTARKSLIGDSLLRSLNGDEFEFFLDPVVLETPKFDLLDGTFFRLIQRGVKDLHDYNYYYYSVVGGVGKAIEIPNWQTLEVMLSERGYTYTIVNVIEGNQASDLTFEGSMSNLSGEWIPPLSPKVGYVVIEEIANALAVADDIATSLASSVAQQQQNMSNQMAAQSAAMATQLAEAQAANAATQTSLAAAQQALLDSQND